MTPVSMTNDTRTPVTVTRPGPSPTCLLTQPVAAPTTDDEAADTSRDAPSKPITSRSRSLASTGLPSLPCTPKTVRMPSRSDPIQPRPPSTKDTKATAPAQLSVAVSGAASGIKPSGFSGVWIRPGRASSRERPTAASKSGFPASRKPKTTAARATAGKSEKNPK